MNVYFYYVSPEYIDYLKEVEIESRGFTCVPNVTYKNSNKFVFGSVMNINGIDYFVPVSSYSKKQQDNILIKDKKNIILGSLRFTYMIPVPTRCYHKLIINDLCNPRSIAHVSKELAFCRRNRDKIRTQAQKTYDRVIKANNNDLVRNSCDFKLLEKAYLRYCIKNNIPLSHDELNHMTDLNEQFHEEPELLEV